MGAMSTALRQPARRALSNLVRDRARALGFDAVGITTPDRVVPEIGDRLGAFLDAGHHAGMSWLATTRKRRADPAALWADCRAIIMLGVSYAPDHDPLARLAETGRGVISAYAKGRDYHDLVKGRLKEIAGLLARHSGADVKVFVDTAPVMEKPLAQSAGLGWQGKHTNLVSRKSGSWLFLGAIMTSAELEPDAPETDHCGNCRRCLDVCPTDAFPQPYRLDARRCIAYLTIEHKGHIAEEFRRPMGNRVFGCDDCLAVCPWNKFAERAREQKFHASPETDDPPLADLLTLDDATFRKRFAGTPVKRTGRDAVMRNTLIAAGNSADRTLLPLVRERATDAAPIVRAMAAWAMARLQDDSDAFEADRASFRPRERDPAVLAEWDRRFDGEARKT
jgi:epoxyqueuosine reductase